MSKKLDIKVLTTTVVTLLPVILGIVNSFSSSAILFIVPIIFAVINVFVNMYINKHEKANNAASVFLFQCRWVVPVISIISMSIIISSYIKIESPIYYIIISLIGIYICSSGVRLIEFKDEKNYTFKLLSLLKNKDNDADNFNTVGYIWIASGLMFIILVYLRISWFIIGLIICIAMFAAPFLIFRFMFKKAE